MCNFPNSDVGQFHIAALSGHREKAVAASYETACDFLQQHLYGDRHKRIPGGEKGRGEGRVENLCMK